MNNNNDAYTVLRIFFLGHNPKEIKFATIKAHTAITPLYHNMILVSNTPVI